jgi:hypothetical protein
LGRPSQKQKGNARGTKKYKGIFSGGLPAFFAQSCATSFGKSVEVGSDRFGHDATQSHSKTTHVLS